MRNVSDESSGENQKTLFMFDKVFLKSCRSLGNVETFCTAGQATAENTLCMLDIYGYKQKPSEYVIFFAFLLQQRLHEHS
jgi:hypothetical protein